MEDIIIKLIAEEIKCSICKQILSYPPIMLTTDGNNICGRCYNDTELIVAVRNKIFEEFASTLNFACIYKEQGCEKILKFGQTEEHEKFCTYRIYKCPIVSQPDCSWMGILEHLINHCNEDHHNLQLIYPSQLKLDLKKDIEQQRFVVLYDLIFVMELMYNVRTKTLWFRVCYIENHTAYQLEFVYKLKISDNDGSTTFNEQVTPWGDFGRNAKKARQIDINSISKSEEITLNFIVKHKLDMEISEQYMCVYCGDTGGWFYVAGERLVCTDCKDDIFTYDSYDLVIIRRKVNLPCKYRKNGCSYFNFDSKLCIHQYYFCKYSNCILCDEDFNDEVFNHYKLKHSQYICYTNNKLVKDFMSNSENIHTIMYVYDAIFVCYSSYSEGFYFYVYSNLPDHKKHLYHWQMKVIHSTLGEVLVNKICTFSLNRSFDWFVELDIPYSEFFDHNGKCDIFFKVSKNDTLPVIDIRT